MNKTRETWDNHFTKLSDFVIQYRTFPNISDSIYNEEAGVLYRWLMHQRKAYNQGKLSDERIQKLESIGFVWDAYDDRWNKQYTLLKIFVQQNHFPPSIKDKIHNVNIGIWYKKQKQYYESGKLSISRSKKLEELGILKLCEKGIYKHYVWTKNFELLKSFLSSFNRLPCWGEKYNSVDLYSWLCSMKRKYLEGNLEKKYIDGFDELGIDISSPTVCEDMPLPAWMQTYEDYMIFVSEYHRHPNNNDGFLYQWENEMLRKYKLGALKSIQIDLLRTVGIID